MPGFELTRKAWLGRVDDDPARALEKEIEGLDAAELPLQAGLKSGSHALQRDWQVMIMGLEQQAGLLVGRAGIFYRSVIAGCNCADDPTPLDLLEEYLEIRVDIDLDSGDGRIGLL